jgi:8-oxo-dGTP pyrophosphatase MutT (NUDIX family)
MRTVAAITRALGGAEQLDLLSRLAREHAAVAAVLRDRDGGGGAELLMVRRAERAGDPWSGHVALPGGLAEPADRDVEDTARRETLEEIGLDLARSARVIGRLVSEVSKTKRGMGLLAIHPIVFALEAGAEPVFLPSPEVQRAFWLPIEEVLSGRLDAVRPWRAFGFDLKMPAWHWDGEVIWGITHRIVSRLLARA